MTLTIREPTAGDAAAIAGLLGELGYPADPGSIPRRLEAIAAERNTIVLVGELDGRVLGLVTAHAFNAIHVDHATAYLTALVVSSTARRHGLGRALLARAEAWARDQGAVRLSLVSGLQRAETHTFYTHLGYERTGYRLARSLK